MGCACGAGRRRYNRAMIPVQRVVHVLTVSAVVVGMAACGGDGASDDDGDDPSTQIANPASVFCVEQGGEVEIVDETDGQVGYCNLPDGTRIEEWAYFNEQTGGTIPEDDGG